MVKLYVLGIIVYICGHIIAEPHARELGISKQVSKEKKEESKRVNVVMSLMPIFNVIMGIYFVIFATGVLDDKIKEYMDKK